MIVMRFMNSIQEFKDASIRDEAWGIPTQFGVEDGGHHVYVTAIVNDYFFDCEELPSKPHQVIVEDGRVRRFGTLAGFSIEPTGDARIEITFKLIDCDVEHTD